MKSVTLQAARARTILCVLGAILGALFFSLALFGQGNFGRILGTVTDPSGAVIAGAKVSVIDTQRGLPRILTTDQAGEYNAPNLIPSTYTVRVEAPGFQTLNRESVVLEVGQEIRVDLTPRPGLQTQSVTITEALPLVDTASATLGGTLSNADINDMPLNGRNYQNLLNLRPGVVIQPGGSPWTQSTNNSRPDETLWTLDGIIAANFSDSRPVTNMPSPFTDGATILPIDAIQEFNLEENAKAEYGGKLGAVVNVGIRSGTNTLHGSAFAFGRSDGFDARNFFNPAPQAKTPIELEQYGGVVGGPIKKDKLFFFAGYEALRSTLGNVFVSAVPATAAYPTPNPGASMVDAINALQKAGVPISPISLNLLGCTAGANVTCTGGLIQGAHPNTTTYVSSIPDTNVSDNGIGKIDYRINDKHMINGMFWNGNYSGIGEDHAQVNSAFDIVIPIQTRTLAANWIWTASSRLVNQATYGWDVVNFYQGLADGGVLADGSGLTGGKGYALNTGVKSPGGMPDISINPYTYIGAWPNRPGGFQNPYYSIQDTVSYLVGKHAFKFGGGFTNIRVFTKTGNTARGRIDFLGKQTPQFVDSKGNPNSTGLEDFFAGNATRGYLLIGNGIRDYASKSFQGFVQDDWRLTQRIMLNLGLRYSYTSPYHEANNLVGNFDPTLGMVQQGQSSVGSTLVHPDYKDFSPRLGIAWDVNGKGTTVVRAGGSVMYTTIPAGRFTTQLTLQDATNTSIAADPTGACTTAIVVGTPCPKTFGGTNQLGSFTYPGSTLNWNGVVFPQGGGISCTAKLPCNLMAIDPNLKNPYVASWNVNVQHAFASNLSLEVGYVGNVGERLLLFRDINQLNPATGVRPYAASFPYLHFINQMSNGSYSNYNSLQVTLTKRLSHGVSFLAGYTYGHGLDTGSLNSFGTLPQNSLAPQLEYASGDFDIRHRFTFTSSYDIPGINGFGQVLKGWKLNGIMNLQTAQPWIAFDAQNNFSGSFDNSDRWDFFGSPGDFKSGSSSIPYCQDPATCSVTSGVSGIQSFFSPSQSAAMWGQCKAVAPDPTTLDAAGCFVNGKSVMVPPKAGTFGTMGRNLFRDTGFKNVDLSLFKTFTFKERYNAQFRIEFFNIFNHPIISNPYGASNGYGGAGGSQNSPGNPQQFGCGCATPDVAAGNPLIGSGSSRVMQLGFKFTF
jgi:hypothetical protein